MARTARQYVSDGLELIPEALIPWVENRLLSKIAGDWQSNISDRVHGLMLSEGKIKWDNQALFKVMNICSCG